jgi:serine/threonine protein kinase
VLDILLDHNGIIKYVDFGAAKVIARQGKTRGAATDVRTNLNTMTGTPMYMSPEGKFHSLSTESRSQLTPGYIYSDHWFRKSASRKR